MGTWGANSFENDDALDWLNEFCQHPSKDFILKALTIVAEFKGDYLEAPECSRAVAASEIVAAINQGGNSDLPSKAKRFLTQLNIKDDPKIKDLALRVLKRITSESELKDLWEEANRLEEFNTALLSLKKRIS